MAAADLPPQPPAIESVLIQAARLPPAASEPAFSVVRLNEAKIAPFDRLDTALRQVPGLSLFRRTTSLSANPSTQGVSLRSVAPSGAGRTLVTLDGVPQNDPFGGWVIWNSLPTESITGVSVVRGAGAGPYGAGALTGVIALEERVNGAAGTLEAGNLDGQRAGGAAAVDLGGIGLFVTGQAEHSDGWYLIHEGRGPADTRLLTDNWSVAARLQTVVGRAVIALRAGVYDEQHSAGLVGASSETNGSTASLTVAAAPEPGALGWRLQGWFRDSNIRQSTVAVSAFHLTTTPANTQYRTPATGWGMNAALRGATQMFEWEVGGDMRAAQGETEERFRFMAGQFTRDRKAGGETLVAGGYVEGTWHPGQWLLTGGVRYDYWSSTDAHRVERNTANNAITLNAPTPDASGSLPSGRIGARYDLSDALYIRSAAYTGFRAPTLNELHRSFRVGNDITQANPLLKPEKLYGAEVAVGDSTGGFIWEANVFYNQLADAITNVTVANGPYTDPIEGVIPAGGTLRKRQNAGTINAYGIEARVEDQITDALNVRLAADYTHARVADSGGLRPAQAPEFSATAGVDWSAPYGIGVHLDVRYESDRYEDDLNSRLLHSAVTVDVRVDYHLTEALSIFGAVDNVLNANVQTFQAAAIPPDPNALYSYGPPRIWRLGISFRN